MIETEGYISVAEAAQRIHLSEEQVRRKLRAGKLRGQHIGNQWFVDEESLPDQPKDKDKEFVPLIPPELMERIRVRREAIYKRTGIEFDVVEMLRELREEA